MDSDKLKEACVEVADILREMYNHEATVTIKGNRSYEVKYSEILLKPDESLQEWHEKFC